MDIDGLADGDGGVGSGDAPTGIDAGAGFEMAHQCAQRRHFSGRVGPGGVRERQVGVRAGAKIGFDGIDADGADMNAHLGWAGAGFGHVFELHDLRPAELLNANRFHKRRKG